MAFNGTLAEYEEILIKSEQNKEQEIQSLYAKIQKATGIHSIYLQSRTQELALRYVNFKKKVQEEHNFSGEYHVALKEFDKSGMGEFTLEGKGKIEGTFHFKRPYGGFKVAVDIPLAYFSNPDLWEKDFLAWVEEVEAMVERAEIYAGFPLKVTPFESVREKSDDQIFIILYLADPEANSGKYDYLHGNPAVYDTDNLTFVLNTGNGDLYRGFRRTQDIKDGTRTPLTCVK